MAHRALLLVEFHPTFERGFDANWGLHLLEVGVFDVAFDLQADGAQGLGGHFDTARRVRLAFDIGVDFLGLIENLGRGES